MAGDTAASSLANVIVAPVLSATLTPSTNTIKIGSFGEFTSNVAGGIPPYTYEWQFTNASLGSYYDAAVCGGYLMTCNPTRFIYQIFGYGYYDFCLFGTDSAPNCYFSTYGSMSGSSIDHMHSGFNAQNYTQFPNTSFTLAPGNYVIKLIVHDSVGNSINSTANVVVTTSNTVGLPTVSAGACSQSGGCKYTYMSPIKYINFTIVNNANVPTVANAPIQVLFNKCLLVAAVFEGRVCWQDKNASSPSGLNNTAWVYDGNIIPSFYEGGCAACAEFSAAGYPPSEDGIYDIFWIMPNVSIGVNKSITVQMAVGNYSDDYIGWLSSNVAGEVGSMDGASPVFDYNHFVSSDLSGSSVFNYYWSAKSLPGIGIGINIGNGLYPGNALFDLNNLDLTGQYYAVPFGLTGYGSPGLYLYNATAYSAAQFNNFEYAIDMYSSNLIGDNITFGYKTANVLSPTGQAGIMRSTGGCTPFCSSSATFIAGGGSIPYSTGSYYYGSTFALFSPFSIAPYNALMVEAMQEYANTTGAYSYTGDVLPYNGVINDYPILLAVHFPGAGPTEIDYIRARRVNPGGAPSVNFGPLLSVAPVKGLMISTTLGIESPLPDTPLQFTINMINSTPAYSIGYTLISRQGSCTTISPSNPVCWVYKSNAMEVASNTYGFQIAPAQTLAYSNTVTQPGNYILLVSADEGERQFANTYLNFTIAGNFVVPISVTNNQALSTGSNFQQMITFNSVAYRSYETNDLGNMRFYQGPNELYSWCESGCSSSSSNSIFWILLPNGMSANSRAIINATFFSTGTEYDGIYAGEAPQLSASYGQYDNGALVFPLYQNFAGGSYPRCSGGWTCSAPFYKGLAMTAGSGTSKLDTNNSYFSYYSAPVIEDTYANLGVTNNALSNVAAMPFAEQAYNSVKYTFYLGYQNNVVGLAGVSFPTQPPLGFHVWTFAPGGIVSASYDYNSNTAVYYQISLNPLTQTLLGYNTTNNALITTYWMRLRINPPNGVMPSVAFGNGIASFPSNILYAIPIALTNKQSTVVAANTAISVPFNALAYKAYETSTLNNTEFFYANGTIIPSWMEGNTLNEVAAATTLYKSANVLFWLRIYPSNILFPANSANTIYMGFAGNVPSASNMLLTNALTGEAPQLSCNNPSNTIGGCAAGQYAEYDNGANVFGVYDDFAGNSLNPMWTLYNYNPSNTALTVENSVDIRGKVSGGTQNAGMYAPYTSNAATNVAGIIYESLADAVMPASAWREGLGYGTISSSPSMEYGFMSILAGATNTVTIIASHSGGGQTNLQTLSNRLNPGSWYVDQFRWSAAHTENAVNLVSGVSANAASSAYSVNQISEIVPIETGQNMGNEYRVQWTRVRTYPPNGIMPAATFGNVI